MLLFYRNVTFLRICSVRNRKFCNSSKKVTAGWYKIDEINNINLEKYFCGDETLNKVPGILRSVQQALRNNKSPEYISDDQLKLLCDQETNTQRHRYLHFLFKKEKLKIADAEKREQKKVERENRPREPLNENSGIKYGMGKNSILINVRDTAWNRFSRYRLANSVLFGKKIVIDLDYDQYMIEKERKECSAQLNVIFSKNRRDIDPFELYFCNANPNAYCVKYFTRNNPKLDESFITLTEKNYLDLFPKENLVYLSPHAKETLKEYDGNAVYIIGGFVDTVKRKPISLNKAETEGIKSYSLPLDDYLTWKAGSKSLTINQAFQIMLTLKNTGNWMKALECVPPRKIIGPRSSGDTQDPAAVPFDENKKIQESNSQASCLLAKKLQF